jgi:hypothetical protein
MSYNIELKVCITVVEDNHPPKYGNLINNVNNVNPSIPQRPMAPSDASQPSKLDPLRLHRLTLHRR